METPAPIVDVAVLGAGIAGLTAAYRLSQAGKSVLVLEGRDRVGGRTLEGRLLDRSFDLGGQWVGPGQNRILALLKELELETFPQYLRGDSLLELQGRIIKYSGVIPRLSLFTLLALDRTMKRVNRMAAKIDPARPWDAQDARELDLVSVEGWLRSHVSSTRVRVLVRMLVRAVLSAEPSEVSMQFFLTYVRSAGSLETLTDVDGAAQQDRIVGGAFQIARRLAGRVGLDRVLLNTPARRIEQSETGVRILSAGGRVIEARFVVLAMSPNLTLKIDFAPERPPLYDSLARRMPMGSVTKALIAYAAPFWRAKGFSGLVASDRGPFGPVFDAGLPDDDRGYLVGFLEG
ncbi:MAG: FAD-dependent oxidoreductase, partial [Leptospirales bacterium]